MCTSRTHLFSLDPCSNVEKARSPTLRGLPDQKSMDNTLKVTTTFFLYIDNKPSFGTIAALYFVACDCQVCRYLVLLCRQSKELCSEYYLIPH